RLGYTPARMLVEKLGGRASQHKTTLTDFSFTSPCHPKQGEWPNLPLAHKICVACAALLIKLGHHHIPPVVYAGGLGWVGLIGAPIWALKLWGAPQFTE
ncbi:MAG: hypothetical protein RSB68_00640, partial [Raoultibacter sp.]